MQEAVIANDISLSYRRNEPIITNANFNLALRDFAFITGKSGSGKSTLLKSLYGEIRVQKGFLSVCGTDMKAVNLQKLNSFRKKIGIVFQDYRLITEWNVEKNVMLPLIIGGYSKEVCTKQTNKLLQHVNLLHKAHKYPLELSGGEQQRVAMARALVHNPVLLLADEPTGNLDDYSSDVIWSLLRSAKEQLGTTIVVVTHKIPTAFRMDYRHFVIEEGVLNEIS